jgi:alpha-tubulin suppressor-like RCC1 family protein
VKVIFKFSLFVLLLEVLTANAAPTVVNVGQGGGGSDHSLFLKSDGSLWAMGNNTYGQLGDGTSYFYYNATNWPEEIVASNVTAVASGGDFSLFLKSDGSLWGMGDNGFGQLGDGTLNSPDRPEEIIPGGVTAIAAGASHSLFVKSDGSLWAMGFNDVGQLGDGTFGGIVGYTNRPEEIVNSGVTAIAAGDEDSVFLKSDGSLWAMGCNEYGQLGDGTFNTTNQPEEIVASNVVAIAASGSGDGSGDTFFIKSDGSLWGMGDQGFRQLGDGNEPSPDYVTNQPEEIVSSNVVAISASVWDSLFLKSDGSLWAMGSDQYGQLGYGFVSVIQPLEIVPSNVVTIAANGDHSLFIKSDGSLWGMGYNHLGALGDGFIDDQPPYGSTLPEQIWPHPQPVLTQTVSNSFDLQFTAPCPFGGNFYLLSGTNLAQPLCQWTPVATNTIIYRFLNLFSNTLPNALSSGGQQFYILQSH